MPELKSKEDSYNDNIHWLSYKPKPRAEEVKVAKWNKKHRTITVMKNLNDHPIWVDSEISRITKRAQATLIPYGQ